MSNNHHPLIQFASEAGKNFDFKKFRDQLLMSIAVGISVYYLKVAWFEFIRQRKKAKAK